MLSDDLCRHQFQFNGNSQIVGKIVQLDNEDYLVLGVMPKGFNFPTLRGQPISIGNLSWLRASNCARPYLDRMMTVAWLRSGSRVYQLSFR
jgi:hypothetical protein